MCTILFVKYRHIFYDNVIDQSNNFSRKSISYALILYVNCKMYILAVIDLQNHHINWFKNYRRNYIISFGFLVSIILLMALYTSSNKLYLEVASSNIIALGLYIWLGYIILQQRLNYYSKSKNGLDLSYLNLNTKNCWRRLLINKY